METAAPAVRMRGVQKRFDSVAALQGVDFELLPGEIHALLGENGAGKSTLMHVLAGLTSPDGGEIEVRGQPVRFRSAREAAAAGIGMVHQHFALVDNLTVAENLALALPSQTPWLLPQRDLAAQALALGERLGWKLDPSAQVWQLPVGLQQRLEIVKVLASDPQILILDEPTAVLAPVELEELFAVLSRLRDEGRSLVFISHKLPEVLRLCDRITVLRRGRNAGTVARSATDANDLARRMIETPTAAAAPVRHSLSPPATAPVLTLRALRVKDDRGVLAINGLDLEVRSGEIVGLAGVDGNGQTELAEAIAGLRPLVSGDAFLGGKPVSAQTRTGIGFIPQDRRRAGLVPALSVRDNLVLELALTPEAAHGPWLRWDLLNERAAAMRQQFDVRTGTLQQAAGTLSGGNQQKIVIARALQKDPVLVVALNPTRGLDVGAAEYVHSQLLAQRERGAAVLLISTELEEVTSLADRVGVLYGGRLMGFVPPDTDTETLGLMMGGNAP